MLRIIAVCDGFSHFETAINEYQKRFGSRLQFLRVAPCKSRWTAHDQDRIRKDESLRLAAIAVKSSSFSIYMDIGQHLMDSEQFASSVSSWESEHGKVDFYIGGAYGIDESLFGPHIQKRLSLSPMTFPHGMALLVLYEQLYRADQIKKNTGYHHG